MSILNNSLLLKKAAADSTPADDPVTRSLRLASGSSTGNSSSHLDRNSIGTPTDGTKWTFSAWVKRSELTNKDSIFGGGTSSSNWSMLRFRDVSGSEDQLFYDDYTTGTNYNWRWSPRFRDPSAWYNLMLVYDASQSVQADKMRLYVNGVLAPSASTHGTSSTTHVMSPNKSGMNQIIGNNSVNDAKANLLIADVYFLDGVAKTVTGGVTDFTELNGYGGLKPKGYTGTDFGNNGFHIDAQPAYDADLLVTSIDRNDGDTLFADAASGHTITDTGNPEHSIAVGNPFTGDDKSIYWDGSSYGLETDSSTDFALGTDDFTIEFWFNAEFSTSWPLPIASSDTSYGPFIYITASKYIAIYQGSNTSKWQSPSNTVKENQWQHFVYCRKTISGTTYNRVWVDGTEISPSSGSTTGDWSYGTSAQSIKIAAANYNYLKGYLHDVRIIKGTAAYWGSGTNGAGDITVPTEKLTAVTNTKLLIQPTPSSDSSWSDIDKSGVSGRTISHSNSVAYADPTASTAYEAAAKSSAMHFDGSGDYLTTESTSDLRFGTGDFTAECWFNPSQVANTWEPLLASENYPSDASWVLYQKAAGIYFRCDDNGTYLTIEEAGLLTTGTWHHVAAVRSSGNVTVYLDGSPIDSTKDYSSYNLDNDNGVAIGYSYSSVGPFNGYIFDARITKGTARYTSDFSSSLPSAPFELNPVYLGGDQSGNKNHFTPTNISMHDVMLDVPTNNYATMSPVSDYVSSGSNTFSEGNLRVDSTNAYNKIASTIAVSSGKWYAEVQGISGSADLMLGIGKQADIYSSLFTGQSGNYAYMIYCYDGRLQHNGNQGATGVGAVGDTDILQIALDLDNNKVWWGKNGTWVGTVGSSGGTTITSGEYFFLQGYRDEAQWNFGQDRSFSGTKTSGQDTSQSEFYYAPPTGFKSLNTSNLDAPVVTPTNHFDVLTYNGAYDNYMNYSGTSPQTITGTDFTPEIVWIKDRDNVSSSYGNGYHGGYWFDNVMGTGYALNTDLDNSSHYGSSLASGEDGISSFNSNGFTVDEADETNAAADSSGYGGSIDTYERYVAWCWKLGSSGSSSTWASGNTDPDTEKYNASAGVSIIDYYDEESSSSAITLNHSLGAAPEFAIAFDYEGYTSGHYVWHKDLSSGNYLTLDSDSAQTSDTDYFPASPATATTFTLGTSISSGTQSHVALFSGVEGYSKFGTYKGAGSSGVFVYTGHRPKMVWLKNIDASGSWMMFDAVRDTYNETVNYLQANSSASETTNSGYKIDILSNCFRINVESTAMNNSAYDYVFCSWAEQPFAAPSNAR